MTPPIAPAVTAQQIDRFASHGYLVLPDLIPPATIQDLRVEADEILGGRLARMVASRTLDPRVTWWRLTSGKPYVLKVKPVVDLSPTATTVADDHALRAVVADLLGAPPALMDNKLMYKQTVDISAGWATLPVLGEEVRKHTDAAYYATRGYPRVLTVAVCLDPCTEKAGALRVWPGSHRRTIGMIPTDNQGPVVPDAAAPDTAAVTLVAAPGTVLVWDAALVHASGPNTSGHPRRLLVLGYSPARPERGAPR
ncbi:phytanoyl-CoA dioxygenase family protein [Micromonospora inyonensis]|uniref:Ectoine hydroxylase-related dioxygenase, phytanoyl-CoA dioxygenase (PhyH) family n=1 Tax=Micromonospora inyonensis TaxID=47866 RepID=A0A1C6RRL0_9ACTN|nr:phytanoyl-CoA dioxygenase family protein [Micromonospora inyonensis]SCL19851.1 Ectoine hydroxylase-related dioxygenase, phytanoyl-CoA dioxygenase (PhyH) family [Micromonospora inyonensis]